jgi:hypothetical protein
MKPPSPFVRLTVEQLESRDAPSVNPILVSRDDLGMGYVSAMAVSQDAHRLYTGRPWSNDSNRLNIGVQTLDDAGKPVGEQRLYADADAAHPLPFGWQFSIESIVPDFSHRKLYVAVNPRGIVAGTTAPSGGSLLTVYDLDAGGEPVGSPRTYGFADPQYYLLGLAVHGGHLYLGGQSTDGGAPVYVFDLNTAGEPQGAPHGYHVGTPWKYDMAVSADGRELYFGSYGVFEAVDVDPAGNPYTDAAHYHSFSTVTDPGQPPLDYFVHFQATSQAVYLFSGLSETFDSIVPYGDAPPPTRPAEVMPLGPDEVPTGSLQVFPQYAGHAFAADPIHHTLWVAADYTFQDVYTGQAVTAGVTPMAVSLDSQGVPFGDAAPSPTVYRKNGVAVALAGDSGVPVMLTQAIRGGVLGNQVSDFRLEVTVLSASGAVVPGTFPISIQNPTVGGWTFLQSLALGQTSNAFSLDGFLKGQLVQQGLRLNVLDINSLTGLDSLQVKLDVWQGEPRPGEQPLRSMTETVQGSYVVFLVPGYGFEPPGQRVADIELMSDHAARVYLPTAQQVALPANQRPQQFNISASSMWGEQGQLGQLQSEVQTLALLGFNTAFVTTWNGDYQDPVNGLSPRQIAQTLAAFGLQRTFFGTDFPAIPNANEYAYFDFVVAQRDLQAWTQSLANNIQKNSGASPGDMVDIHMADEPGWDFPAMLNIVRNNPAWLQAFRGYLQQQGFQPAYFGEASWDNVFPAGASAATTLEGRHLFYWTIRYFGDSAARGLAMVRSALQQAFPNLRTAEANWNNYISRWYSANPDAGPDTALGSFDWLQSSRLGASNPFTEDWIPDQQAETLSLFGDALRSSAMLGPQQFGGFVVGRKLGGFETGASYKILSLIGHGAKSVDVYGFGPELWAPGDAWSEHTNVYGEIADALGLVGRAEPLLYEGQPSRGKVAVLLPGTSDLWNSSPYHRFYQDEIVSLQYALTHAGYTVDFVDDVDLAQGELAGRGYTTLYLTGPNLSAAAGQQVRNWVSAGGTLVVTEGAAVADEYNTPTSILDPVLGLQPRTAVRDVISGTVGGMLNITDAAFGAASMGLYGPVTPLVPLGTGGASVEATLQDDSAGITLNLYGKGVAIAYGFFPGWQYWESPSQIDLHHLPQRWGELQRQVAVAPVRLANTPKPVTLSQEVVEADRLDSRDGIAIVLLNWTDQPIRSLTITVPNVGAFHRVRSAQGVPVQVKVHGHDLEITLSLDHVDVLLIGTGATVGGKNSSASVPSLTPQIQSVVVVNAPQEATAPMADLSAALVGVASGHTESTTPGNQGELPRMDLLPVREQEAGHLIGQEQDSPVMNDPMPAGTRRTPGGGEVDWLATADQVFADDVLPGWKSLRHR